MFKYLQLVLVIFALTISSAQAKTYIRNYNYTASEADSKITARTNSLDQVKLLLLQEIGTHIRHEINITKDGSGNTYVDEDIEAITASLTKVEIIEEDWNGDTYYLKAEIEIDTQRVLKALEEIKNEKSDERKQQLEALKENQRNLEIYRKEIESLRKEFKQANNAEKQNITNKYRYRVDQIFLSDMAMKGYNFFLQGEFEDAVYWSRKAAKHGQPVAQSNLAAMYDKGQGVKQNYKTAVFWYREAANQGFPGAQLKSDEIAVKWYRKTAEKGHPAAQNNLGELYNEGRGVKQSYKTAKEWYKKACDGGFKKACGKI